MDMRRLKAPLLALALAVPVGAILLTAVPQAAWAEQTVGGWRKDVADKVKEAQEAGQKGHYDQAIQLLQQAKAKGSLSPQEEQGVNELMIWAASASRNYRLLASTLEERLATGRVRGRDKVAKLDLLAKTYFTMRDYRKCADTTDKLIKARGSASSDDLVMLGQSQFLLKDYRAAVHTLENAYSALRRSRGSTKTQVQVLQTLNAAYFELKDEGKRVETLHQLMVVHPTTSVFDQLVSEYQKERLDSVGMLNLYRLGDRLGVVARSHWGKYADAALDLNSPGEAIHAMEKGIASGGIKKDDRSTRLLADTKQQLEALRRDLPQQEREAKAIASGDADSKVATAYFTLGDKKQAVATAERAIKKGKLKHPDDAEFLLGVALYDLKKPRDAESAFKAAAKANPKNAGVANLWEDVAGG